MDMDLDEVSSTFVAFDYQNEFYKFTVLKILFLQVECIMTILIYKNLVKGYLAHKSKVVVLSKQDPFPKLNGKPVGSQLHVQALQIPGYFCCCIKKSCLNSSLNLIIYFMTTDDSVVDFILHKEWQKSTYIYEHLDSFTALNFLYFLHQ